MPHCFQPGTAVLLSVVSIFNSLFVTCNLSLFARIGKFSAVKVHLRTYMVIHLTHDTHWVVKHTNYHTEEVLKSYQYV